jgi:streptomycin 6-kinase
MPDNGGCTAGAAADLFSSFKRREPLRGERVHIAWLGPGAGWLVLMPDNVGGTAGAAADLFSSFYLCGDSDYKNLKICAEIQTTLAEIQTTKDYSDYAHS